MTKLWWAILAITIGTVSQAYAQDQVAERAVAAAREYVKSRNMKEPKLTILLSSLYNNSFPDFAKRWEELTGVKFEIVPLGYTDIIVRHLTNDHAKVLGSLARLAEVRRALR